MLAAWALLSLPVRADELDALNKRWLQLFKSGQTAEATAVAERALSLTEQRFGRSHPSVATALLDLAILLNEQRLFEVSKPLIERSVAIREKALGAQHPHLATSLQELASVHRNQGRLKEALPLAKRALAIREKALGERHEVVGQSLEELVAIYKADGRHGDAEPHARRLVEIYRSALGHDHPRVGLAIHAHGESLVALDRMAEAEPLLRQSIAILERKLGGEHPVIGKKLRELFVALRAQRKYAEAEVQLTRALAIAERDLGPDSAELPALLQTFASLYRSIYRDREAEALLRRGIQLRERRLGKEHADVAELLHGLAELLVVQRRYGEAEPLLKRALAIREQAPGQPDVGQTLALFATLLVSTGRVADGEAVARRSLAVLEEARGAESIEVAEVLETLGAVHQLQLRFDEAERALRRAIAVREKVGLADDLAIAQLLGKIAELYDWSHAKDKAPEAEKLLKRALAIWEKRLGPDHPETASLLLKLAKVNSSLGRPEAKLRLAGRALALQEKALGPASADVAQTLDMIGFHHLLHGNFAEAVGYLDRSTRIMIGRLKRGHAPPRRQAQWNPEALDLGSEIDKVRFHWLIQAQHKAAEQEPALKESLGRAGFEAAQWALVSSAAASLSQMAERHAIAADKALAELIRERQDLAGRYEAKDSLLTKAIMSSAPQRADEGAKSLHAELATIDERIREIDATVEKRFPDHASLSRQAAVGIDEARSLIGADEAIVMPVDAVDFPTGTGGTFLWVVTKATFAWHRVPLDAEALRHLVQALRCGLDRAEWSGEGASACAKALGIEITAIPRDDQPLPFDHAAAFELYRALFGEFERLIRGKHLLVVNAFPLSQFPLQALVAEKPDASLQGSEANRRVTWLARRHAVTVLPAVASLKALRSHARRSNASKTYAAFGNPLLDGDPGRSADAARARAARDKQQCTRTEDGPLARFLQPRSAIRQPPLRGGLADPAYLRAQAPLPETADELCTVARQIKAESRFVYLGARASERNIKSLSGEGRLADFHVVHFATHGAMAGEIGLGTEPGLILTPPAKVSAEDDGYLAASEIAGLRLNADWVVLSACNTGASAGDGEALSGLARAFFYAGTRALLVSQWAVYSDATVKLITGAFDEMTRDGRVGRSEALRRSMLALADNGEPVESHPAYWAPFVLVGEGAAAR